MGEVPINHRLALLDVSRENACPSQPENIDQFEFPVVEWGLRYRMRHGQEAADAITILEGLPESAYEPRFGLDLEGKTLSFLSVFMRYAFRVVASHAMPVPQLLDQARGPLHLTLSWRPAGLISWYERDPSHHGFCSTLVLSTQVTLLGGHALDVVEGFIVRVLRFLVEMLDAFWSAGKSVTVSATVNLRFTEEEKLRQRPPAIVIRSVDGNVVRPDLRSFHLSRSFLGLFLLLVEDFGLDDDGEAVDRTDRPSNALISDACHDEHDLKNMSLGKLVGTAELGVVTKRV